MRVSNVAPEYFRKVVCVRLSRDFAAATEVRHSPFPTSLRASEVVVRNLFAGVNASDINYTAGVYKANLEPPFDVGFEGLGTVVAVGESVKNVDLGDYVITQSFGTFSECQVVPSRNVRKVKTADPKLLPLEVSGATASIAIERTLRPMKGEVALVTAAAGGTGQFAVQLLKRAGCHVIGTCSSRGKAEFLRELGVDRVVDYNVEPLDDVLTKEYRGLNVVYESVGGNFFDIAVKHLATRGRMCVIGNVSGYRNGDSFGEPTGSSSAASPHDSNSGLANARAGYRPGAPIGSTLLWKSATLSGFFLPHYQKHIPEHVDNLTRLLESGELVSHIDPSVFRGVGGAAAAVDYLMSGKSCGKVVLRL
jgi:NADPH-dependent curcumin reductase CurA